MFVIVLPELSVAVGSVQTTEVDVAPAGAVTVTPSTGQPLMFTASAPAPDVKEIKRDSFFHPILAYFTR